MYFGNYKIGDIHGFFGWATYDLKPIIQASNVPILAMSCRVGSLFWILTYKI